MYLKTIWKNYSTIGEKSKGDKTKTEQGIKDTFQEHFLDILSNSHKTKCTILEKRQALAACLTKMPENTTSPVLRLQGKSINTFFMFPDLIFL